MVRYFLQVHVPHFFVMPWWVMLCEVISCILFTCFPYEAKHVFFILSLIHQYRMSKYLESLDRILDVSMPCAVMLLVSKGVLFAGCRCHSLMQAMHIGRQCRAPRYMPPILASEAEATTFLMV